MIKAAVIGAGRLGGFHAQKLAAHEEVQLVGVVDPIESQRTRVAENVGTAALADMSELPRDVQAVIVATPTGLHHRVVMDLLRRGVHVMVEKPICSTLPDADELVEQAHRAGVVLAVGHVERFNPAFVAASEAIVEPTYIETVRRGPFSFRSTDVGVVLDLMIHDIDLVLSLVGRPVRRIEAVGGSVLGGHEDRTNARLYFDGGCVASLTVSRVSYDPKRHMEIWSDNGHASVDFGARTCKLVRPSDALHTGEHDLMNVHPEEVPTYKTLLEEQLLPEIVREFEAVDALALEDGDFIAAIGQGTEPRVTGKAGRDALKVALGVLEEIAHGGDEMLRRAA